MYSSALVEKLLAYGNPGVPSLVNTFNQLQGALDE
jgi:hypothetical protein